MTKRVLGVLLGLCGLAAVVTVGDVSGAAGVDRPAPVAVAGGPGEPELPVNWCWFTPACLK